MSPRIRFEPIGEEIDCAPEETVLDAAFRHGYNLVYGCREGQCSACKCFLLEGDVALRRYSSFALSDSERANGYSLMCRAVPEDDVVVELLHYDRDGYRLEHAIRDGVATVSLVQPLTHNIVRLVLETPGLAFTPGQYVDLWVPDDSGARRSFSMANLPGEDRIELIIRRYPEGRFSALLDGDIKPGDELAFTGPYGSLHVHGSERPILMIAGGSGMAPVLSLLRELARTECQRPVRFFYGAQTEADLFGVDEIAQLG
jgi:propane monooxygenase reductase component